MEKRTREIIALVILVVLGLVIACAMGVYIVVGHNWNNAATHIDDYVGEMEGYTVIVYEGVLPHKTEKKPASSSSSAPADSTGASGASVGALPAHAAAGDHAAASGDAMPADAAPTGRSGASQPGDEADGGDEFPLASRTSADPDSGEDVEEVDYASLRTVADSYREKDADVLVLHIDDVHQYEEPVILKCGDRRIGVFANTGAYEFMPVMMNIAYLKRHSVDVVVCISTDRRISKVLFDGMDVVVYACDDKLPPGGAFKGHAFCVDSPEIGEVQAVIQAPNGMLTAKTIASQRR